MTVRLLGSVPPPPPDDMHELLEAARTEPAPSIAAQDRVFQRVASTLALPRLPDGPEHAPPPSTASPPPIPTAGVPASSAAISGSSSLLAVVGLKPFVWATIAVSALATGSAVIAIGLLDSDDATNSIRQRAPDIRRTDPAHAAAVAGKQHQTKPPGPGVPTRPAVLATEDADTEVTPQRPRPRVRKWRRKSRRRFNAAARDRQQRRARLSAKRAQPPGSAKNWPHAPAVEQPPHAANEPQRRNDVQHGDLGQKSTLGDERFLLLRARRALLAGHARRAALLVKGYLRMYPDGQLHEEGQVLEIRAQAALGNKNAARWLARSFRRYHPHSMMLPALRTLLEDL